MLGRRVPVVAADDRDVEDLLEAVPPGLARLELEEVEDLVLALEHQVVEAMEDRLALGVRGPLPAFVDLAGAPDRRDDVVGGALRDGAEQLAREGLVDLDALALAAGMDAPRERLDLGGADARGGNRGGGGGVGTRSGGGHVPFIFADLRRRRGTSGASRGDPCRPGSSRGPRGTWPPRRRRRPPSPGRGRSRPGA